MLRGIMAGLAGCAALLALSGPAFSISAESEHSSSYHAHQRSLGADLADKDRARSLRSDNPAAFMNTAIKCRYMEIRKSESGDWTWCSDHDLWEIPFSADELDGYLQRLNTRPH